MARYVKTHDPNHLVTTGEGGHSTPAVIDPHYDPTMVHHFRL